MLKYTLCSVAVFSFFFITTGANAATTGQTRASFLQISPKTVGETTAKKVSTSSPLTVKKITSTLNEKSADVANNTSYTTGSIANSAQRASFTKRPISAPSSSDSAHVTNNIINELQDRIDQLQDELNQKTDIITNILLQMDASVSDVVYDLQDQIQTNKTEMDTVKTYINNNITDQLNNYVTTNDFNKTKQQLSNQIADNAKNVVSLRADLTSGTQQAVAAVKTELEEKINAVELQADTTEVVNLFNAKIDAIKKEYIPITDRDAILADAEAKVAEKDFLTVDTLSTNIITNKLGNTYLTTAEKNTILDAVDSKLSDYIPRADRDAILADAELKFADKGFLTMNELSADIIKDKLGNTYLDRAEKDTILNTVDGKLSDYIPITDREKILADAELKFADKGFLTMNELSADIIKDKLGNTYLDRAEKDTILNTVDGKLSDYIPRADRDAILADAELKFADKGFLTRDELSADIIKDRLGNTYLDKAEKDTILNTVDGKLSDYIPRTDRDKILDDAEAKIADKGFLTADKLSADIIKDRLGNAYLDRAEKDTILNTVDGKLSDYIPRTDRDKILDDAEAKIADKGFLTADKLSADIIKDKLGNTYLVTAEKDAILNTVDGKLSKYVTHSALNEKGFLTQESPILQTMTTNINNLNTNLQTTAAAVTSLGTKITTAEESLKTVDSSFVPAQIPVFDPNNFETIIIRQPIP